MLSSFKISIFTELDPKDAIPGDRRRAEIGPLFLCSITESSLEEKCAINCSPFSTWSIAEDIALILSSNCLVSRGSGITTVLIPKVSSRSTVLAGENSLRKTTSGLRGMTSLALPLF